MRKNEEIATFSLRIPTKVKTKLEKQAKEERRSLNQQIAVMLERATDKRERVAA